MADFKDYYDQDNETLKALKRSLADELAGARAELKETQAEVGMLQIELNIAKARRDSATSDASYQDASSKIAELEPRLLVRGNRLRAIQDQIAELTRSLALIDFELDRQAIDRDGEVTNQAYQEFKRAYEAYTLLAHQFHDGYISNLARAKSLENRAEALGISRLDYFVRIGGPGGVSTSFPQWLGDLAIDGVR